MRFICIVVLTYLVFLGGEISGVVCPYVGLDFPFDGNLPEYLYKLFHNPTSLPAKLANEVKDYATFDLGSPWKPEEGVYDLTRVNKALRAERQLYKKVSKGVQVPDELRVWINKVVRQEQENLRQALSPPNGVIRDSFGEHKMVPHALKDYLTFGWEPRHGMILEPSKEQWQSLLANKYIDEADKLRLYRNLADAGNYGLLASKDGDRYRVVDMPMHATPPRFKDPHLSPTTYHGSFRDWVPVQAMGRRPGRNSPPIVENSAQGNFDFNKIMSGFSEWLESRKADSGASSAELRRPLIPSSPDRS